MLAITVFNKYLTSLAAPSIRSFASKKSLPFFFFVFSFLMLSLIKKKTTKQEGVVSGSLASALKHIEKQFGEGSVMRMGEKGKHRNDISVVSTGSLALDEALGVGGFAKGRIVEIFGPESSGKTTLALSTIRFVILFFHYHLQ